MLYQGGNSTKGNINGSLPKRKKTGKKSAA